MIQNVNAQHFWACTLRRDDRLGRSAHWTRAIDQLPSIISVVLIRQHVLVIVSYVEHILLWFNILTVVYSRGFRTFIDSITRSGGDDPELYAQLICKGIEHSGGTAESAPAAVRARFLKRYFIHTCAFTINDFWRWFLKCGRRCE